MSGVYTKKCVDDVFDTSDGALPFKLQRIAEEELGETLAKKRGAVEELTQLLLAEPGLNANKDVAFLLRFLRVRKYNVELALQTIRKYYSNRAACPSIYREFLPSKAPAAARKLLMVLPDKDVHGRPIFLCKTGAWVPAEVSYEDVQRAVLLCLEHLASDPAAQTLGVVIIVDYAGLTADKLLYFNIGLIRRILEYIQDCMPMRMKAFHTVRQSYAFDLFFALVKPFIKTKMAERFRFYGENFEKLHEEIPPKALPVEYGGEAPPLDFDAYWSQVDAEEQRFEDTRRFGYVASDGQPEHLEQPPHELTSL